MKRLVSILLSALMFCSAVSAGAYSTESHTNGDVNLSGTVTVEDVTSIQKYLVRHEAFSNNQKLLADTDLNGKVNIMDATKIQRVLVGTDVLPTDKATQDYKIGDEINIYFKNNRNWSTVNFYVYNSKTGEAMADWPGTAVANYETDTDGKKIFSSKIDVSKYDRIIFNDGTRQTMNIPISKASSGFYIYGGSNTAYTVKTFAYTGADKGTLTTTTLNYSTGYDKKIWIWTPSDYSADSAQKFKTVYMTDGQNLFADHSDGWGGWETPQAVEAMMSNGGRGVILVGIDNGNAKRDSELTPDIGEPLQGLGDFSNRTGEAFANFVADKVMPYVQANYNSSTKAEDNIIAGSSSGGLEAFYIGLEHKDKFGGIGALSPAHLLFNDADWDTYLDKFDFTAEDMPRIYSFNGKGDDLEVQLYGPAETMHNKILSRGYDENKITFVAEEAFSHNEGAWRVIFPEMLSYLLEL